MDHLLNEVRSLFGAGAMPSANALVNWDGFDQWDKEYAVKFYSGKTWKDVLAHNNKGGTAHKLEEWSVLCEPSLSYYGRAHLEYLFETADSVTPDDEFVSQFFHQLYQLVYMHKGSPFTASQTDLLVRIAKTLPLVAVERGVESLADDYVVHNIELYLEELTRVS
ncbi:hypothetical protein ACG0Z6_05175 [Roseateles sp. BYS180W]|uniref:Uncharacterized protein n=1 Tax=Roseateles rivi TaxID=3299028 RepID=A0ABW7FTI5_9BURK